jgi:MFS family permease
MMDELRGCQKCGYETNEAAKRCPKCGGQMFSAKHVRRLGWVALAIGLLLVGLMGTITFKTAPLLLNPGLSTSGAQSEVTREQVALILGLFGSVIVFGLISMVSGLWQIRTGRRNRWLIYITIAIFAVVALLALSVLMAIDR